MPNIFLLIRSGRALFFICVVFANPAVSEAFDYSLDTGAFSGGFANVNYWNPYTELFDRDETFTVSSIHANLTVETGKWYSAHLSGAIDWVHDFKPESRDDFHPDLVGAYLHLEGDRTWADIGKQPFLFGRGLILDEDEPGVHASWEINNSYYVQFKAALSDDTSPLVALTTGYRPGFLENIEAFAIYMRDRDNGFADLLNREVGLDLFSGEGDLFWIGLEADLFLGSIYLSGTGMFQYGNMHITQPEGKTGYDITAWLLDLEGSYNFTPNFSGGLFLFAASGDKYPGDGDFRAFISPRPYNTRADVFFNGGLDGHDLSEGFSLGGILWPGVIAPGFSLVAQPDSRWLIELSTAALFPQNSSGVDYTWYGWETDITVTRTWNEFNTAYLLFGLFSPGDMIDSAGNELPDAIVNAMIGVSLVF